MTIVYDFSASLMADGKTYAKLAHDIVDHVSHTVHEVPASKESNAFYAAEDKSVIFARRKEDGIDGFAASYTAKDKGQDVLVNVLMIRSASQMSLSVIGFRPTDSDAPVSVPAVMDVISKSMQGSNMAAPFANEAITLKNLSADVPYLASLIQSAKRGNVIIAKPDTENAREMASIAQIAKNLCGFATVFAVPEKSAPAIDAVMSKPTLPGKVQILATGVMNSLHATGGKRYDAFISEALKASVTPNTLKRLTIMDCLFKSAVGFQITKEAVTQKPATPRAETKPKAAPRTTAAKKPAAPKTEAKKLAPPTIATKAKIAAKAAVEAAAVAKAEKARAHKATARSSSLTQQRLQRRLGRLSR